MNKETRMAEIEKAAYQIFSESGFKGASMLAIAKAAKASNETLYKWYGDKLGLFTSMIERNTKHIETQLLLIRKQGALGLDALDAISRPLLTMLVDEPAIILNRAAASDSSGKLGAVLAREGRARVYPILYGLIEEAYGVSEDNQNRLEVFISLLVGDWQIRRASFAIPQPSDAHIYRRADQAMRGFKALFPAP